MPVQPGSALYFVFLAGVFFLYWTCAASRLARLSIIRAANFLFCAHYGLFYIVLIPACATIDFLIGLGLMSFRAPSMRRLLVTVSILVNLSLLVGSRHMGLVPQPRLGPRSRASDWDWVFPLGLSFYTLQALTYTIDLYRRDAEGTSQPAGPPLRRLVLPHPPGRPHHPRRQPAWGSSRNAASSAAPMAAAPLFLIGTGVLKKALIADLPGGKPGQPRIRHAQPL